MERKLIAIVRCILRFGRSKRQIKREVVRTEHQVQQALRVKIALVIEIVDKRTVETASFVQRVAALVGYVAVNLSLKK